MKLVDQYMTIFFTFSPTSNHLHPPHNSRLVVDEDDNVNSGTKGLNPHDVLKHHFASLKDDLIS